jgi:hypothetical protein
MPRFTGFAELRTPCDLLRKLEHDLRRMAEDSGDTYAAFDFFITAEHLLDWQYPDPAGKATRKAARQAHLMLEITSHIASGAKHFVAIDPHHKSVSGIEKQGYADDYVESGYIEEPIVVKLSPNEAAVFGSTEIGAVALGNRVLAYWRGHLAC